MVNTDQYTCLLAAPERRLSDGLNLWVKAKESYFEPDHFRLNLNNTIQALRNVTFILQKTKSQFPNFSGWYSNWQDIMRADPLMKWLVEARNIIVKEGDLETHSTMRVSIVDSWLEPPKFEMLVPPFAETRDLALIAAKSIPKEAFWDVGLLRVERRWVDFRLPKQEVLETLSHSFNVLSQIIFDAHKHLLDEKIQRQCPWFISQSTFKGHLPPCMLGQDWERTIWVDIRDGSIMVPEELTVNLTDDELEVAVERYAGLKDTKPKLKLAANLQDEAALWFQHAKVVLRTDGYHEPIALIGYPNGSKNIFNLHITDRTQKNLLIRDLAVIIEKTGANSVILINEIWVAEYSSTSPFRHAADDPERKEALLLIAADNSGQQFSFQVLFSKDENDNIIFGEEAFSTETEFNILDPIMVAWAKRKSVEK